MKLKLKLLTLPVAGLMALAGCAAASTSAQASTAATCANTMTGPITSNGDEILANGSPWVTHGVTVSGLEHSNYTAFTAPDAAQITAAHTAWCANTIRLQVSQQRIDSGSAAYRTAVYNEVRQAVNLNMAVVINDQTQWDTAHADVVTKATYQFWAYMAARYKTYKRVIFDMLNEPSGAYTAASWYTAFHTLAVDIRKAAPNLIWAEGLQGAGTLAGIGPSHFLGVSHTAYVVHHPLGTHDASGWNAAYGYLQAEGRPVVDGEWTNWSANRGECWSDAPTAVPDYLAWMKSHGIGYDIWAIGWDGSSNTDYASTYTGPAVLANGSYSTPVSFGANWSCTTGLHQGAGQDIMNDFHGQ